MPFSDLRMGKLFKIQAMREASSASFARPEPAIARPITTKCNVQHNLLSFITKTSYHEEFGMSFLFQVQVAFFSLHPTGPTEKCLDFNSFALHLHLLRLGDVLAAVVLHWQVRYLSFWVLQPVSIFSVAHSYIQLHTATTSQEWPSLLVDIWAVRGFTSLRQQLQTHPSLLVEAYHPGFSQRTSNNSETANRFIISWGSSKGV